MSLGLSDEERERLDTMAEPEVKALVARIKRACADARSRARSKRAEADSLTSGWDIVSDNVRGRANTLREDAKLLLDAVDFTRPDRKLLKARLDDFVWDRQQAGFARARAAAEGRKLRDVEAERRAAERRAAEAEAARLAARQPTLWGAS
ncbi:MAG TPA: hypothetical protein VIY27_09030 [Myxococcota bacterium]